MPFTTADVGINGLMQLSSWFVGLHSADVAEAANEFNATVAPGYDRVRVRFNTGVLEAGVFGMTPSSTSSLLRQFIPESGSPQWPPVRSVGLWDSLGTGEGALLAYHTLSEPIPGMNFGEWIEIAANADLLRFRLPPSMGVGELGLVAAPASHQYLLSGFSWYVSLHTDVPTPANVIPHSGTTFPGFSATISGRTVSNSNALTFNVANPITYSATHWAIGANFRGPATEDEFVFKGALAAPVEVPETGSVRFAAGQISITWPEG